MFNLSSTLAIGGTSVIILVGVAVEVNDQIDAKLAGKDTESILGRRSAGSRRR